jgi:hydroxypyruvate reductase
VRPLTAIHLHAARPAGVNEPTAAGVAGAEKILELAASLQPHDVCLFLISGGGSALLPAPAAGISLADKQAVTRFLSAAGANIRELNIVRKQLSRIKGGGLARAAARASLFSLIISDVLGDPLDLIASGPTVPDTSTPAEALAILTRYSASAANIAPTVIDYLQRKAAARISQVASFPPITNHIIGNNAVAVDAAGIEAERRGYSHAMHSATSLEGLAEDIGRQHAELARAMRHEPGPDCLITGGEPVVQLVPAADRGRGGRNQQLALAALGTLGPDCEGIALLSGGTDGEDGPTDAAGAFFDSEIVQQAQLQNLSAADFLRRNDAYHFFERTGGLLKTGPTDTNVCDLRVIVTDRIEDRRGLLK